MKNTKLTETLDSAEKSGMYYITVTYLDKTDGTLKHLVVEKGFPPDDIPATLRHFMDAAKEKLVNNFTFREN